MIHFYIGIGIVGMLGYFGFRYLDGDLTVSGEEVIEKGNIRNSFSNDITGQYFIVKRTYVSGRIKIFRKNLHN